MGRTPSAVYDEWLSQLTVHQIERAFSDLGCTHLLVKVMTGNQGNTKQQIYCGTDFSQTSRLPMGEPRAFAGTSTKKGGGRAIFRAPIKFSWLRPFSFAPAPAPDAKLIFYPQYPEVRLSGFIRGCDDPPTSLMSIEKRGKENRRTLLLGVSSQKEDIFAVVLPPESPAIDSIVAKTSEDYGPFRVWQLHQRSDSRTQLLTELRHVIELGPSFGRKLSKFGTVEPYSAPNAGGYTLEALLGVSPNGVPLPDYLDWEIKAHKVQRLDKPVSVGRLTLLTPEPDGGVYVDQGVEHFLRNYGYSNRPERYDFAGTLTVCSPPNARTRTILKMLGYRSPTDYDPDASIAAVCDDTVIASWSFEKILGHWSRKHAKTAYVPYMKVAGEYEYGAWCSLGEETTFAHLLRGFEMCMIQWDPGIKMELRSSGRWKAKKRNQFRTNFSNLPVLYEKFSTLNLLDPAIFRNL